MIKYLLMKMETEEIETENDDFEVAAWIRNQEDFEPFMHSTLVTLSLSKAMKVTFLLSFWSLKFQK